MKTVFDIVLRILGALTGSDMDPRIVIPTVAIAVNIALFVIGQLIRNLRTTRESEVAARKPLIILATFSQVLRFDTNNRRLLRKIRNSMLVVLVVTAAAASLAGARLEVRLPAAAVCVALLWIGVLIARFKFKQLRSLLSRLDFART